MRRGDRRRCRRSRARGAELVGGAILRPATAGDAEAIDRVVVAAFREQGEDAAAGSRIRGPDGRAVPIPVEDREAWWEVRLRALADAAERIERGVVIVAEQDGQIVGTASVLPTDAADVWELVRVAVQPDSRGARLGYTLIEEAIAAARDRGAVDVRWTSDPFQTPAHAIYDRLASADIDEHGRRHYRIEL